MPEQQFFGEFVLNAETTLAEVAAVYGLELAPELQSQRLCDFLTRAFNKRPVVGDRHRLGGVELVVREVQGGRISQVGLRLAPSRN
jgi:cell volume regulation protein A